MNAMTKRTRNLMAPGLSMVTAMVLATGALAMSTGASQVPPQTPPATPPAVAPAPAVEPQTPPPPVAPAAPTPEAEPALLQTAPAAPTPPSAPAAPRAGTSVFYYSGGSGPYLGVDLRDVTSERIAPLKLKEERGAEVTMVDQDSPAGKAGIKEQDVILTFNGTAVESVEQLRRMIRELPPGRTVTLGLSRDGKPVSVSAQLADRKAMSKQWTSTPHPNPRVVVPPIEIEMPDFGEGFPFSTRVSVTTARIGVVAEALTPQLGEFFGVSNGHGLLVKSVEKGSIAEAAGVRAGDVIIKIGNDRISDSGDWRMAMREHTGATPLTIVRDKREQTLTVKLPDRKQTGEYSIQIPGVDWDEIALNIGPQIEAATRLGMQSAERAMAEAQREVERALRENKVQIEREKIKIKRDVDREKRENKVQLEREKAEIKRAADRQKREIEREKTRIKREVKIRRVDAEVL